VARRWLFYRERYAMKHRHWIEQRRSWFADPRPPAELDRQR
jgi:hypothetical protein